MTIRFVSAIYDIADELRGPSYPVTLWERAAQLSAFLPGGLHVCCDPSDVSCAAAFPYIHAYPLRMSSWFPTKAELPHVRHPQKDTYAYLALQNAKPDFLLHVKQQSSTNIKTFIWIDAGILKVLQSPAVLLPRLRFLANVLYPDNKIRLPGPGWRLTDDTHALTTAIWWRFCGGLVIVPTELVTRFAEECKWGCQQLFEKTGRVTWEVNVWTYLEAQGRLPFELVPGDHNDTILDGLFMS